MTSFQTSICRSFLSLPFYQNNLSRKFQWILTPSHFVFKFILDSYKFFKVKSHKFPCTNSSHELSAQFILLLFSLQIPPSNPNKSLTFNTFSWYCPKIQSFWSPLFDSSKFLKFLINPNYTLTHSLTPLIPLDPAIVRTRKPIIFVLHHRMFLHIVHLHTNSLWTQLHWELQKAKIMTLLFIISQDTYLGLAWCIIGWLIFTWFSNNNINTFLLYRWG